MMDVLQCNIVKQMIYILEGLIPVASEADINQSPSAHESIEGKRKISYLF